MPRLLRRHLHHLSNTISDLLWHRQSRETFPARGMSGHVSPELSRIHSFGVINVTVCWCQLVPRSLLYVRHGSESNRMRVSGSEQWNSLIPQRPSDLQCKNVSIFSCVCLLLFVWIWVSLSNSSLPVKIVRKKWEHTFKLTVIVYFDMGKNPWPLII